MTADPTQAHGEGELMTAVCAQHTTATGVSQAAWTFSGPLMND